MKIIKDSPKKKAYKQKIVNKEVGMKDNIIKDKYLSYFSYVNNVMNGSGFYEGL